MLKPHSKSNRLEFYLHTPDGLSLHHSRTIYGRITVLNKIRPASSRTDHLFVGTDRFHYFTLSWDSQTKQLRTEKSYIDQSDKSARDSQTGERCHLEPGGRYLTLELYEGVVTVIPIVQSSLKSKKQDGEIGTLGEPIPIRTDELFVRDSTFFQTRSKDDKPRMAFIYEDSQKRVRLKVRQLTYQPGLAGEVGSAELAVPADPEEGLLEELELGASHVIPVPGPSCGMLVLGETSILYYEYANHTVIRRPLREATIFCAWTMIDRQRYVLADEYGKLHMLMLVLDTHERVTEWKIEDFGECSRATTLIYMDAGILFVGSHSGDSQLIYIEQQDTDTIQTLPNIAPILDFTIMDMGNRSEGTANEYSSGQARLVTGSGAYNDGSLRSVRSGVGLEDLGMLAQLENITNVFSISSQHTHGLVDTLVVSLIDETRVFRFTANGDVEELEEFGGLSLGEATLLASTAVGNRLLQVTAKSARLLDSESSMVVAEWTAPSEQTITATAANESTVVLSIGGLSLIALDTTADLRVKTERVFADKQIACLSLPPALPTICLVGYWQSSSISILSLEANMQMQSLHDEILEEKTVNVPRSMLLLNVLPEQPPTLFVALADGNVITYSLDPQTCALSGRRSTVLGTQQAGLTALPKGNGLFNVFATCDHSSLIYGSEGRLVYSAITAEDAVCICPFNAQAFPGAIAIATKDYLKLAVVDEERATHVQGLPIGATVRRIAYSSELKAFGLGTITRELKQGAEIVKSRFQLVDEVVFKVLNTFELNTEELVESVMRCQLDDGYGNLAERFVVGTAYLDDENTDAVRGRILVFEVTMDRQLKILTELEVKGACRCLNMVEGKIVAALVKTVSTCSLRDQLSANKPQVVVYSFDYTTPSAPYLRKIASYRTSTAPIDLAVTGSRIAIADLMKSVSVVEYKNNVLTEVARHFQTAWATAVALIDDHTFLEADAEGNLIVLSQDVSSDFAEDRRRLKITSEILLGEMVNRIRPIIPVPGADPTQSNAIITPKAFLATVEGSIYLFGTITPANQNMLMELQRAIAKYVLGLGNVPFMKYRAYKSVVREEDEPMRFVDGEVVELFLDVGEEVQKKVLEEMQVSMGNGKAMDVEGVRTIVERLRRLR